ncbi:MAG: phage antirepressor KilAC domain-containing protein, partial [Oscillospiraceae bacterium]
RRHGAYITPEVLSKMEDSPEFTSQLIRMLKQEQDKTAQMQEQMESALAKTDYFDRFMETDTLTSIRNTAKEIRIPEKLFTYLLEEMGFAYRANNQLWPYAFMVHYGYATLKDYVVGKHGGTYMLFTPLGKLYLQKRIAGRLAAKNLKAPTEDN